jgi:hypothetical protein
VLYLILSAKAGRHIVGMAPGADAHAFAATVLISSQKVCGPAAPVRGPPAATRRGSRSSLIAAAGIRSVLGTSARHHERLAALFPAAHPRRPELQMVMVGFALLTLGIVTGAWPRRLGIYWSWDPKETWSLVTWLVYAAFLHARFTAGWRGKSTAVLSVIGFAAVIFTYIGVNFVLSGLHSYG